MDPDSIGSVDPDPGSESGSRRTKMTHPDADPDPQDPHVFVPPGSGSISQRYGYVSGSGSFPFDFSHRFVERTCLQNRILTQNFSKKIKFVKLKRMCLLVS